MQTRLVPRETPQDGSIWASHFAMSAAEENTNWQRLKDKLDRAALVRLAEGSVVIDPKKVVPSLWMKTAERRNGTRTKTALGRAGNASKKRKVSVLHWYTRFAPLDEVQSHAEWLIRKIGFHVAATPLFCEFPNETVDHGHTMSYLLSDGGYAGLARHTVLAESHLAVGSHLSFHTFPVDEGGVVYYTLVTWDEARFFRIQYKLDRWVGGNYMGAQFFLTPEEDLYTLACCSRPKFGWFMQFVLADEETPARPLFRSPDDFPLPLTRDLLRMPSFLGRGEAVIVRG